MFLGNENIMLIMITILTILIHAKSNAKQNEEKKLYSVQEIIDVDTNLNIYKQTMVMLGQSWFNDP